MEDTQLAQAETRARLGVFVGQWRAEGESFAAGQTPDAPRASTVPWRSEESYEWLPGGHFLLHRWDAMVGDYPFQGLEVIGVDATGGGLVAHLFDNAGNSAQYQGEVDANAWRFAEAGTRSVIRVNTEDDILEVEWEWKNGGDQWLPLCRRTARRLPVR